MASLAEFHATPGWRRLLKPKGIAIGGDKKLGPQLGSPCQSRSACLARGDNLGRGERHERAIRRYSQPVLERHWAFDGGRSAGARSGLRRGCRFQPESPAQENSQQSEKQGGREWAVTSQAGYG